MNYEFLGDTVPGTSYSAYTYEGWRDSIPRPQGLVPDNLGGTDPKTAYFNICKFIASINFTTLAELKRALFEAGSEFIKEQWSAGNRQVDYVMDFSNMTLDEIKYAVDQAHKSLYEIEKDAKAYVGSLVEEAHNLAFSSARKHPLSHYQNVDSYSVSNDVGYSHTSMLPSQEVYYNSDLMIPDAVKNGYTIKTELDSLWFEKHHIPGFGQSDNYYRIHRHLTIPKDQKEYWSTLAYTVDPVEYINLLKMYKCAGVTMRYYKPVGENYIPAYQAQGEVSSNAYGVETKSVGICSYLGNHPSYARAYSLSEYPTQKFDRKEVLEDRFIYAEMVRRFYEVVYYYYMRTTQEILDFTTIEDLPALETLYSSVLNRQSMQIGPVLNTPIDVTIFHKGQRIKTETMTLPDNEQDGPLIDFPEEGFSLPVKQAMLHMYEISLALVDMNINKLEARIAELRSPQGLQVRHESVYDPTENPFLVLDPVASQAEGAPVFTSMAQNLTNNMMDASDNVIVDTGPTWENYLQAPAIRQEFKRQYMTSSGLTFSYKDLKDIGAVEKKGSITPWLIGGAITAYGISQVI